MGDMTTTPNTDNPTVTAAREAFASANERLARAEDLLRRGAGLDDRTQRAARRLAVREAQAEVARTAGALDAAEQADEETWGEYRRERAARIAAQRAAIVAAGGVLIGGALPTEADVDAARAAVAAEDAEEALRVTVQAAIDTALAAGLDVDTVSIRLRSLAAVEVS